MAHPTSEASRKSIKGHVTRWVKKIKEYENETMTGASIINFKAAEEALTDKYNKFTRLSYGVYKDMEAARSTQA